MKYTVISTASVDAFLEYILNAIGVIVSVSIVIFAILLGLYLIRRVVKMFIR